MKVVSNAGPLIALGKLGQLSLLLTLYDEILIPREVYHEVVTNGLHLGADDALAVDLDLSQFFRRDEGGPALVVTTLLAHRTVRPL